MHYTAKGPCKSLSSLMTHNKRKQLGLRVSDVSASDASDCCVRTIAAASLARLLSLTSDGDEENLVHSKQRQTNVAATASHGLSVCCFTQRDSVLLSEPHAGQCSAVCSQPAHIPRDTLVCTAEVGLHRLCLSSPQPSTGSAASLCSGSAANQLDMSTAGTPAHRHRSSGSSGCEPLIRFAPLRHRWWRSLAFSQLRLCSDKAARV